MKIQGQPKIVHTFNEVIFHILVHSHRYTPTQTIVTPGLASASYLHGSNLVSTGAKIISNAGYAGYGHHGAGYR